MCLDSPNLTILHYVYSWGKWYTFTADLSASVIVLTISGSISFLLYRGRSRFSGYDALHINLTSRALTVCIRTNRILTNLTLYIVASGAITRSVPT